MVGRMLARGDLKDPASMLGEHSAFGNHQCIGANRGKSIFDVRGSARLNPLKVYFKRACFLLDISRNPGVRRVRCIH